MKMRKFVVEIHPDGHVTCCEYEEPRDASKDSADQAWLAGYRQALIHCERQVKIFEEYKGGSWSSSQQYVGAAKVRDTIASYYRDYANRKYGN